MRLLHVWSTTLRILLSVGAYQALRRLRGPAWAEDALPRVGKRNARLAVATVSRVQGLFVKVGQMVSMLAGALPAAVRDELADLHDRVPPRPWPEIAARLESELGKPPEAVFATMDRRPIAAASLAQVHAATLADGRRVAVKVQHQGIERLAEQDLRTVRRILGLVGLVTRAHGLPALFDEVRATIEEELDFAREAAHARTIAGELADDPSILVPAVVPELSTGRVLVTAMIDGVKVTDREALLAQGIDPADLARRILEAYCHMIFSNGIYHADPHPGNLLVDAQGRLAFVDFGAVGKVTESMRAGMPLLVEAVVRRDREATLEALARLGFVPRGDRSGDRDVAERLIDYVYGRFLDQVDWRAFDVSDVRFDAAAKMELMADMRHLDLALHDVTAVVRVPREWLLLLRTLILLLGVATELDPALRPVGVLRPHVEPLLLGEGKSWMGLLGAAVKDLGLAAITLPTDLHRLVTRAQSGDLQVEVGGLRESSLVLIALGRQLVLTLLLLGSAGLAFAAHLTGEAGLARLLLAAGGLLGLGLLVSLWRMRARLRRLRRGTGRP